MTIDVRSAVPDASAAARETYRTGRWTTLDDPGRSA